MKKLKAIICMAMAAVMSVAVVCAAGCHSHTYSEEWVQTDTEHWKAATCEHTDEKGELGEHVYDSNYVCTICGYQHTHTYSADWTADDTGHWHATECGHDVTKGFAAHRYNSDYTCTTCGYHHEHTYSQTWSYDASKHWYADTCGHGTITGEAEHDWDETYTCKVCGYSMRNAGISISKEVTEYTLSAKNPTVDIPLDDISVKLARVNESLVQDITDYTLEFYKGAEKLENLNGLGGGAYNVWAKATVEIDGAPVECESFVIIYVIDDLTKLTFNKDAEDTVTTQGKSVIDRMSGTWSFTATYASGATETVYPGDNLLLTGLDTNKVTAGSSATATYTTYNSKGDAVTKSANVFYTVTEAQNDVITSTYSFDALKATLTAEDQAASTTVLPAGALGGNAFVTVLGDSVAWYRGPTNNVLEIQNDALKVTITGVGTISLSVDSTSSTNISSIALKDSDGNFVVGTPGAECVEKDDEVDAYSITGKGGLITFIILQPGEYTICTISDITVNGDIRDTNRHTRIQSLVVVDEKVVG
ncbi:MAG: hypothetical protein ACI4MC_06560 [Candidatus Coproplasma sp.]